METIQEREGKKEKLVLRNDSMIPSNKMVINTQVLPFFVKTAV